MFTIQSLTTLPLTPILNGLIELLRDSVEGGASVGFLSPLRRETAEAFWQDMLREVGSSRVVLVATTECSRKVDEVGQPWAIWRPNLRRHQPLHGFRIAAGDMSDAECRGERRRGVRRRSQ